MSTKHAMTLIGNAKQAMSKEKSDPVETGPTGPAAMAPQPCSSQESVIGW